MAAALAFVAEGFREVGRKVKRAGLRRQMAAQARERDEALVALGNAAWASKIDLAAFAPLREQLVQLHARAGELAATTKRLDAERADLTARRKAEAERFDGLARAAQADKTKADGALATGRATLAGKDHAIAAAETRLARIASELARPAAAASPAPGASAQAPATQPSGAPPLAARGQLEVEQKRLQEQAAMERAARLPVAAEVERLEVEAKRQAEEVARIERERKAALLPLDEGLKRVDQQAAGATRDSAGVGRQQRAQFGELGKALYDGQVTDAALTEPRQAVSAIDQRRAESQATLDASLALSRAMPRGTLARFYGTGVVALLLLAAVLYTLSAWSAPSATGSPGSPETGAANQMVPDPMPDETRKDQALQAYLDSPGDAGKRQEAVAILKEDLLRLGATADRSHIPVLVKLLRSDQPEIRAAAAEAIGMIGPTPAEAPALTAASSDPVPEVRAAAANALTQVKNR